MTTSCIVITSNDAFMGPAAFLVAQLRAYGCARTDIFVATDAPLSDPLTALGAQRLPIAAHDIPPTVPRDARLQGFTYWKLAAIAKLAQTYARILYLDTDIFCAAPGIEQLLDLSMSGKALAAVLDVHHLYRPNRKVPEFEAAGLPHAPYFNAGVLMVDGHAWRARDCDARIEAIAQSQSHLLSRYDQSILNLLFHGDWLELSPVWNWQYSKKNAYLATHAGPRLVHYAGRSKLWSDSSDGKNRSHWLIYDHAPERLEAEERMPLVQLHRQFLKSALWYHRANLRHLSRFESDFATIAHGS